MLSMSRLLVSPPLPPLLNESHCAVARLYPHLSANVEAHQTPIIAFKGQNTGRSSATLWLRWFYEDESNRSVCPSRQNAFSLSKIQ